MTTVRSIALEKVLFLPSTRVTDDVSVLTLKSLVLEPLLTWRRGRAAPGLFDRWTGTDDGRRWQFHIRDGAAFHDGTSCRPAHILAFIEDILQSRDMFGMKWAYARYFANTRFSEGPDNTVVVEDPEPIAHVQDVFCEFFLSRPDHAGRSTVGTGPWRVREARDGESVILDRIGGGDDRLVLSAVAEAEARLDALHAGRVDAAMNLERADPPPERGADLVWLSAVSTLSVMAYLDCSRAPFAGPRARRAVNLAVDRGRIVRDVFHGYAEVAASVVSPSHLGMRAPIAPLSHDPGAARALMDQIGGPASVTLRTPTTMPEHAPEIAAAIARDLEAIGWNVRVDVENDRPEYARQIGRREMGDIAIFDSSPHGTFRVLSDKVSARTRGTWWQGYDDPVAEELMAKAFAAVADDARERVYAASLRHLADHPPWLYLVHPVVLTGVRPGTPGLTLDNRGVLNVA